MLKLFKTSIADFPFCKKGGIINVCSVWKVTITNIQTFDIRFPFYFNEGYFLDENEKIC